MSAKQPEKPQAARLSVKVTTRARRNQIVGWSGDRLKVKIAAVPEGGRANEALTDFLAKTLDLPRRSVRVVVGHTATSKVIELDGLRQADLLERLEGPGRGSG